MVDCYKLFRCIVKVMICTVTSTLQYLQSVNFDGFKKRTQSLNLFRIYCSGKETDFKFVGFYVNW